jgi:type I restriction enzyme R subunit
VNRSVAAMFKPEIVMDVFQFFTLFATDKKFRKYKIICRYQQFEGANLIVERVKAGYPKKGLIWHFQGSGKSLLMVFAAQKLRMTPELKNPTVVIVDDRIDLETQITRDFNAADIPNMQSATSKEELIAFFKGDMRKILITTIFKFGEVDGVLNPRDNIILMVDEAHRTQEGNLGEKMRTALPKAFFFGLTGTPINRTDKNTFFTFGATEDKSGYMSRYSFSDSIRDNATLPLHFEAVPVELHVNQDIVDAAFDVMTETLSKDEKNELARRVKMEAIMKSPERIRKVCEHIAKHYREKIEPNGFKGQVVCYDRECCLLYKTVLDELLGEDATTIVMDTNNDKEGKYKAYRRDRDAESRLLDHFRESGNELKLVIVTAKLLTGFDAPILQVMYLDKPMKDHTLLQAICRTNRVYGQAKTHGLIVDYIGIFDDVAKALDFDEKNVQQVITNIDEVKKQLPALMDKCLSYFTGVDRTVTGWEGLVAAQDALPTNTEKDAFGADYRVLSRAWEALSPDSFLNPYKSDYIWVSKVYESVKPVSPIGSLIWAAFGAKTLEIVHQNIEVTAPPDVTEILELDADLIDEFFEHNKDAGKKTKELEINLIARIRKHDKNDRFIKLGERLEELREKHEQGLITSIEFLKHLLILAREVAEAEREVVPEPELDKGKAALTELFNGIKNDKTPIIVERIVTDIDGIVKIVRFDGWQNTTAGQQEVKKALRSVVWVKYKIKDTDVFDKAYKYIEMYY